MSAETLETNQEKKTTKFGRELEIFAPYVKSFTKKEKDSRRNRFAGKLSVGTEKGGDDIIKVQTERLNDKELGMSLVERAMKAAEAASEAPHIDLKADTMSSRTVDESGVERVLVVGVDRSADRLQHTHGDMRDSLNYTIVTLGNTLDESHRITFSVGLSGKVTMTGPDGSTSTVHARSDTAERMMAQIDAFPPVQYATELPF